MKLGKHPARINSVHLRLSAYLDLPAVSPLIPAEFGAEHLEADFTALGSDQVADCVWAGFAHEVVLANREVGREVSFSPGSVLADYSAAVGYNPDDPTTDIGTDLQSAASYRRRIGLLDAAGQRHRVGAYVNLTTGDPDQLAAAAFIFGSVGVGLRIPDYSLDEAAAGNPWAVRYGVPQIVGGLYVPVIGRAASGNFYTVAWGRVQEMTPGFYRRYCDESVVFFSEEFMTEPVSPLGFDRAKLLVDLQAFTRR